MVARRLKGTGGDRSSTLLGRGSRDGEPWEEYELIVTLAACPPQVQDYDSTRPWVIELADLLGRSPGAISKRFGNFFTLKTGDQAGLAHASRLTRQVFERYVGREDELFHDAREIRARLYEEGSTPRVEVNVSDEEADVLQERLQALFPEARLPPDTVIVYRRAGSWWVGLLIVAQVALVYREDVRDLLRAAIDILGGKVRRSPTVDLVLEMKDVALAERIIRRRAPEFHPEQLSEKDRITLALRLSSLPSLRKWRPTRKRLEFFSRASRDREKDRVGGYFGIDAARLCDRCLMMLLDLLDEALATGKL